MIFRLMLMIVVLFLLFYGFLRLCFTKGFLNRKRLKTWNKVVTLAFFAMVLVIVAVSMFAGIDQSL